jgi:hypothetical protein
MRLDHFVVHVDNNIAKLKQLAAAATSAGMPFNPKKGKGTSGFRATNIWIGDQYFEIPWLRRHDGGGWKKEWVELYNNGQRGAFCIFLLTRNLRELKARLEAAGVAVNEEKVSFKAFGLFTKVMPWTTLHLPRLPGTNLEISFIEYEPICETWFARMSPNAKTNGIEGVLSGEIEVQDFEGASDFLRRVFPESRTMSDEFVASLEGGTLVVRRGSENRVTLFARSKEAKLVGKEFSFEDVTVKVVS